MIRIVHGIVRGKTIQLDEDLGVAEGQQVEVQLKFVGPKKHLPGPPPGWTPGSTKTVAGAMADSWTDEDDRILQEIHDARRHESRRTPPE